MLIGWLGWQHDTVRLKCTGLDDEAAHRAPLPTSPGMSVAGLVSHLTWVERAWLEGSFLGDVDLLAEDPQDGWVVTGRPLATLLDAYEGQGRRSLQILAGHELDEVEAWAPPGLDLVSLRWIATHLVEETGRHLGHLDLLREMADGVRGQ